MEVFCRRDNLKHESLRLGRQERLGHVLKEGLEIVFEKVHYEVDTVC